MDKLKLLIYENGQPEILRSTRKYTTISFYSNVLVKKFNTKVLKKFGSNIRVLKIHSDYLTKQELIEICELTHLNLKALRIFNSKIQKNREKNGEEKKFKFNKLTILEIINCDVLNDLAELLPDNLNSFSLLCHYSDMDITELPLILERQKNLKHLDLKLHAYSSGCLDLIDNKKIQFKLESLGLDFCDGITMDTKFGLFLESQAAFIETLKLKNFPESFDGVFKNIPKVKWLEVGKVNQAFGSTSDSVYSPSLRTLVFNYYGSFIQSAVTDFMIVNKFTHVPEIIFKTTIWKSEVIRIISTCPGLTKLTLQTFSDGHFNNIGDNSFKFLKELTIENSYTNDLYMDSMFVAAKNLEVLKLGRSVGITTKSLFWLLRHFKKLMHLEIQNGSAIKSTFLCTEMHLFQNLTFLRISSICVLVEDFKQQLNRISNLKYYLTD